MAKRKPNIAKIRASQIGFKKLLNDFEDAVADYAFIGGHDPADHEEIKRRYRFYRAEVRRRLLLASLVNVELRTR